MSSRHSLRFAPRRAPLLGALALLAAFLTLPAFATAGVGEAIGDTLTVIMKPLLNIPTLVEPGHGFTISCSAGSGTTGWTAELVHNSTHVPLTISSATYDPTTLWWSLAAEVPNGILYELYDLHVTAAGGIDDRTKHAVKVIPGYLSTYYFVHVTDSHCPTNMYYYETGAANDSTSMMDLRAVFDDLAIINPEFVLFTGDLVNEGELEDYLTFREYTRAQRLLAECQVPVFLTSGNHDIGGWDATPPPPCTSRKNWWRFFGWPRLGNPPPGAPARTQDYSFDYGPVHFTGLEAYNNSGGYDDCQTSIYGANSFTGAQIAWLNADLAAASGSASQVLFYHYDFSNQINLSTLGVEMALSGHIHSDTGSLTTPPYDLTTNNTDNGERSYRIIRVSNGVVSPTATIKAGSTGQNLRVIWSPSNDGSANSVTASVVNNQPLRFENALLKFVMPPGEANYIVTNGTELQRETTPSSVVVYVQVDLLANATKNVTVTVDYTAVGETPASAPRLAQNRPNPFNPRTDIAFTLAQAGPVRLVIYSADGRLVSTLVAGNLPAGDHTATWDGRDAHGRDVPSGTYFYRLESAAGSVAKRLSLVR